MNFNGSIKIYSLIYINKDYFITYKLTKYSPQNVDRFSDFTSNGCAGHIYTPGLTCVQTCS